MYAYLSVYMYTCVYVCICVYTHTYIKREEKTEKGETERGREGEVCTSAL